MITISNSYVLIWRFKDYPHYQITRCQKVFNTQTNRQLKKCYNSGSIGYWIQGKWINVRQINSMVEKIPKREKLPF